MPSVSRIIGLWSFFLTAILIVESIFFFSPFGFSMNQVLASYFSPSLFHLYAPGITGSYNSQRFLSYVSASLQRKGWKTQLQRYTGRTPRGEEFYGENLLAYQEELPSPKILLIVPYDRKNEHEPNEKYLESMGHLVDLVSSLAASEKGRGEKSLNIAFVSGHYQEGSGLLALLKSFQNEAAHEATYGNNWEHYVSRALILFPMENPAKTKRAGKTTGPSILAQDDDRAQPVIDIAREAESLGLRIGLTRTGYPNNSDERPFIESIHLKERGIENLVLGVSSDPLRTPSQEENTFESKKVLTLIENYLFHTKNPIGPKGKRNETEPLLSSFVVISISGRLHFIPRKLLSLVFCLLGVLLIAFSMLDLNLFRKNRLPAQ